MVSYGRAPRVFSKKYKTLDDGVIWLPVADTGGGVVGGGRGDHPPL